MTKARAVSSGAPAARVHASEIRLGTLLAEGGEGRVYEVANDLRASNGERLVYKQLRRPRAVSELSATVSFLEQLATAQPGLAARVRSSCAWPAALVVGDDPHVVVGVLLARAPEPFSVCHREGEPHLSTLSYLASDPDRITVAYGIVVPGPGTAVRVGVVYALARLLEAWQAESPGTPGRVAHGDLSAKNVLWSLDPVPAVYVLDCDGATIVAPCDDVPDGEEAAPDKTSEQALSLRPVDGEAGDHRSGTSEAGQDAPDHRHTAGLHGLRLRATTPNWEDPALVSGLAPSLCSDRYALGLAFLRVVGAAHFPLQARQRAGGKVNIDLELPRSWRRLPDMPALWDLCGRSLSVVEAEARPSPTEWAGALEELLAVMGAGDLAAGVRAYQGDRRPSLVHLREGAGQPAGLSNRLRSTNGPGRGWGPRLGEEPGVGAPGGPKGTAPDVEVRPVLRHRTVPTWRLVDASAPASATSGLEGLGLAAGLGPRQILRRCGLAWAGAHRLAWRLVCSRGRRRDGLRRLAGVLALDLAGACLALFLVGMIVSPWIGL